MAKVFFSYSHRDEELRDELEVHLSTMKRQGVIETWHDRRIEGGQEFGNTISDNLEDSEVILLLISPYFLASDYCYNIEMQRAMEKHDACSAKVIPVILHPCDWHSAPFGKLLAVPNDGKPISKYPNHHDAFLEITNAIKRAVSEISPSDVTVHKKIVRENPYRLENTCKPRSSNLRVKKSFSEQEKDEYLEESFEYMVNFFEASLEELSKRNASISTRFKRIDANHFTASIYDNEKKVSQCKIWLGGFVEGIAYSSSISSNDNSFNESMSMHEDGYTLSLKPMGMASMMRGNREDTLTQQGASEYYWEMLIQYLQ